jgi:ribulose-5-phosphate 4-epimerase/fuculose-1-phosphate aldolase
MLASLGTKNVLVLRNHGLAVADRDIPNAFFLLWIAQRAAEIQCKAAALPGPDVALADTIKARCSELAAGLIRDSDIAVKLFDATVRKMRVARAL